MDILLGMAQAPSPSVLSTANTSPLPSVLLPPAPTLSPASGIPIHQLYKDDNFFLLVFYPPAMTVVTCKFSPLSVEVKAVATTVNLKKLRKEFHLSKSLLAEFHV